MVVQKQKITYAQYAEIAARPENAGKILELVSGEIVEKMPSFTPSKIASRINYYVTQFLMRHPIGYVTGKAGGYILSEEHTFNPDVGYISKVRLPKEPSREAPVAPDMAVEVKSPTDSKREMRKKAEIYLQFGTRLVWLVFPEEQAVEVYVPDKDVQTFGINDSLDGGDVLPDFQLAVKDIFAD
jgi:Uma2 family endonuclease